MTTRSSDLIAALTRNKPTREAMDALWLAARMWLQSGGSVPFERFAGLPNTAPSLRRYQRDCWIERAAAALQQDAAVMEYAASITIADRMFYLVSRGIYQRLIESDDQAARLRDLDPVSGAVFQALLLNNGEPLSQRHVYRILSKD